MERVLDFLQAHILATDAPLNMNLISEISDRGPEHPLFERIFDYENDLMPTTNKQSALAIVKRLCDTKNVEEHAKFCDDKDLAEFIRSRGSVNGFSDIKFGLESGIEAIKVSDETVCLDINTAAATILELTKIEFLPKDYRIEISSDGRFQIELLIGIPKVLDIVSHFEPNDCSMSLKYLIMINNLDETKKRYPTFNTQIITVDDTPLYHHLSLLTLPRRETAILVKEIPKWDCTIKPWFIQNVFGCNVTRAYIAHILRTVSDISFERVELQILKEEYEKLVKDEIQIHPNLELLVHTKLCDSDLLIAAFNAGRIPISQMSRRWTMFRVITPILTQFSIRQFLEIGVSSKWLIKTLNIHRITLTDEMLDQIVSIHPEKIRINKASELEYLSKEHKDVLTKAHISIGESSVELFDMIEHLGLIRSISFSKCSDWICYSNCLFWVIKRLEQFCPKMIRSIKRDLSSDYSVREKTTMELEPLFRSIFDKNVFTPEELYQIIKNYKK